MWLCCTQTLTCILAVRYFPDCWGFTEVTHSAEQTVVCVVRMSAALLLDVQCCVAIVGLGRVTSL